MRLDPDLATIVATALEKEPDRRYASAAAFSEDVGRFLGSQPILARPPSTMYQLRKLVARRKPLFATIAAAALLLLVARRSAWACSTCARRPTWRGPWRPSSSARREAGHGRAHVGLPGRAVRPRQPRTQRGAKR